VESKTNIMPGIRKNKLQRVGSDWQLAQRKILLDQSVLLSKNPTFFF
jgi:hypothetical protein